MLEIFCAKMDYYSCIKNSNQIWKENFIYHIIILISEDALLKLELGTIILKQRKDDIAKYIEYSDFVKPVIKLRMKSTLYWNVL